MAREQASRKYQLTINNPEKLGFSHEQIKSILTGFHGLLYWCLCDEVGEEGTPHTHVYVVFQNAVMFSTLQQRFYGAHIEIVNGSHQANRDYIRKEGKWAEDAKQKTNKPETFEESGELPPERISGQTASEAILAMIKEGASNAAIVEAYPTAMNKLPYIEQTRQMLLAEQFKNLRRAVKVHYIWGDTGVGKTRSIMDKYGDSNVYRVTDYKHPFDGYKGQAVIVFEEFHGDIPLNQLLTLIDIYPVELPCRYSNKVACYTEVYFVTNIPLEKQYLDEQYRDPKTWDSLIRRITDVVHMLPLPLSGEIF